MVPALFLLDFQFGLERFADPLMSANMLFLGVGASAACFAHAWGIAVKLLGAVKDERLHLPRARDHGGGVGAGAGRAAHAGQIGVGVVLTCAGLVLSERGKGAPPAEAAACAEGGATAACGQAARPAREPPAARRLRPTGASGPRAR